MKTMKQIITVVALAIFMLGSFSGNAQENNPLNEIGIEHNDFMNYFLKQLKTISIKDKENVLSSEIIKTHLKTFFSKKYKNSFAFIDGLIIKPVPSPTFPEKEFEKSKFSKSFKTYSKKIFDLTLNNDTVSLIKLVDEIKKQKFSEKEKNALLAINSIAYNSLDYWTNNLNNWMKLNNSNQTTKAAPPAAHIGAADVGGAIVGAIAGGVTTGGVGAVPGAIIGGAGASASQAMVELVDWLW